MTDWKHRTTEEAQDALSRFCKRQPVMSIPVNRERDADIILSDVISERDALAERLAEARRLLAAVVAVAGSRVPLSQTEIWLLQEARAFLANQPAVALDAEAAADVQKIEWTGGESDE